MPTGVSPHKRRTPLLERFWANVDKERNPKGCWEWQKGGNTKGYGYFWLEQKVYVYAHRFSWELHFGPIPEGLFILHHCDNPRCVNPIHLFIGTKGDNIRDCISKGRHHHADSRGDKNPSHKLTWEQVRLIRKEWAMGITQQTLADKYGVSQVQISHVVKYKNWIEDKEAT